MRFEFLAPDAAEAHDGARPLLRSPIEWVHRRGGAEFTERAGWRVVSGYGDPAAESAACRDQVALADLSHLGKVEVQADPPVLASIVSQLAGGSRLAPGLATLHDEVWWCPMSPSRVIAVTPPEATGRVRDALENADTGGSFASVIETTAAWGSNAVVGPRAREAFARSTALDLRPDRFGESAFAPVSVARTPGLVLRQQGDRFIHFFGAGYARYVWTVFIDAVEHLGGRPVGADALSGALHGVAGAEEPRT